MKHVILVQSMWRLQLECTGVNVTFKLILPVSLEPCLDCITRVSVYCRLTPSLYAKSLSLSLLPWRNPRHTLHTLQLRVTPLYEVYARHHSNQRTLGFVICQLCQKLFTQQLNATIITGRSVPMSPDVIVSCGNLIERRDRDVFPKE